MTGADIDKLLERTVTRPRSVRPPTRPTRKPLALSLKQWASSQVAAYRVGLVLGYVTMMYFGTSAFIAGIPTFTFTTPHGWTPLWSAVVVLGGLVAGVGAIRAGAEPVTKEVKVYNRIELAGAIALFLTLGSYAAILLVVGYGFGDAGRASIGSGFVALGIQPAVRMIWLIFRPRFLAMKGKPTAPVVIVPSGHALFTVDPSGKPLKAVAVAPKVED